MTIERRRVLPRLLRLAIGLALVASGTAAAAAGMGSSQRTSGTLDLRVTFGLVSNPFVCPADVLPPGVPPEAVEGCRARSSTAPVRGLGIVSLTYTWPLALGPPTCPPDLAKALPAIGRLDLAGKGAVTFALAQGPRCVPLDSLPQNDPQELTFTGGTGSFAGASGRGTVAERSIGGGVGSETWTARLDVPGLDFDVTPPVISGAADKTARAKRGAKSARVTFQVTARDDRDGTVRASCMPRSGSAFRLGRTKVSCEAVDTSANAARTSFTITVKKGR